jgi:hypothetical protein
MAMLTAIYGSEKWTMKINEIRMQTTWIKFLQGVVRCTLSGWITAEFLKEPGNK